MGNEDDKDKRHDDLVRKQREALENARSVVQRPTVQVPTEPKVAQPKSFVTYPEFAPSPANSPGSRISFRRLLLALYLSAGAGATMYVVSKLVIQPLVRQVVRARREYYQHSLQNVQLLVDKLSEGIIFADDETNTRSADDPSAETDLPSRLNKISETLSSQINSEEIDAHNELSIATEDLFVYLNSHVYASTPYGTYGIGYGGGTGGYTDESAKADMINRVKTEIRSIKGAVLNIRNFPAPVTGLK